MERPQTCRAKRDRITDSPAPIPHKSGPTRSLIDDPQRFAAFAAKCNFKERYGINGLDG